MSIIKEFKQFAIKGNAIDMAVGIVIGAAFGKIIASLVNDVIMPPIGMLMGGINFTTLQWKMGDAADAPVMAYGNFIQATVDFLIIAFAIFMVVRLINNMKKKEEAKPAATPADIVLLTEIRDSLKK